MLLHMQVSADFVGLVEEGMERGWMLSNERVWRRSACGDD